MNKRKCKKSRVEMKKTDNSQIEYLHNQKAITLIALVISIIVMLILAGISLNATIGENGVLTQAKNAKIAQEDAAWYENAEMTLVEAYSNVDNIPNIPAWLIDRFTSFSNGEDVMVSEYKDGYLIVSGKRMITVNSEMQITSSRQNSYLISTGDDWYFLPNGTGTCKLTAYKMNLSGTISIPSVVTDKESGNVYMVTELFDGIFSYAANVKKIDFSSSYNLEKIGASAFAFCSNLEINLPNDLPDTITSIGDKAFYNCSKLNGNINLIMSKGYALGKGVFMKCPNLTGEIQFVFNQNFYLDESGKPVSTIIEESQFSGYTGLTGSLTIPYYITEIKDNAFYGCTGISELIFEDTTENPSDCISIGTNAFYECNGITSNIVFPKKMHSIGNNSFYGCSNILGVTLPNELTTLGEYAFYECSNLTGELLIPNNIERLEQHTFENDKINKIIFNNNSKLTFIGDSCFKKNPIDWMGFDDNRTNNISTLPPKTKELAYMAFAFCTNLLKVQLPDSIETLAGWAFGQCHKLEITHWSNSLVSIGWRCFNNTSVTELPLIDSLIRIDNLAFENCGKLNAIDIIKDYLNKSSIQKIESSAFYNVYQITGTYTGSVTNKKGENINLENGCFLNTSVEYASSIPEGITVITANSFSGITNLTNTYSDKDGKIVLKIPDTVTKIEKSAFYGCTAFTKLIIPASVTQIEESAFYGCTKVESIIFENGSKITDLNESVFAGCRNLTDIKLPEKLVTLNRHVFNSCPSLKTISLPETITTIGYGAFSYSGLTTINLPNSVKKIDANAFTWADLRGNITIPDSVTELGNYAFANNSAEFNVVLGKGINNISNGLFSGCGNLGYVQCKGEITSIGNEAFYSCVKLSKLKGITWNNVNSIGTKAFFNCNALNGNITLKTNCIVYEDSFENCPLVVSK